MAAEHLLLAGVKATLRAKLTEKSVRSTVFVLSKLLYP